MTEAQAKYLADRKAIEAALVSSVHSQNGKNEFNDKVRTRIEVVNTLLKNGENPYNASRMKEEGKNLGGSLERTINHDGLRGRDEAQVKELETKWGQREPLEILYLDDVTFDPTEPEAEVAPGDVYCSFCGLKISKVTATSGKGPLNLIIKQEIKILDGIRTIEEKLVFHAPKVAACKDCCLNVKDVDFPSNE